VKPRWVGVATRSEACADSLYFHCSITRARQTVDACAVGWHIGERAALACAQAKADRLNEKELKQAHAAGVAS
jgi:hypothetical protein